MGQDHVNMVHKLLKFLEKHVNTVGKSVYFLANHVNMVSAPFLIATAAICVTHGDLTRHVCGVRSNSESRWASTQPLAMSRLAVGSLIVTPAASL